MCFIAGRKGFITTQRAKKLEDLKKKHLSNSFQKFQDPPKPGGLPPAAFLV